MTIKYYPVLSYQLKQLYQMRFYIYFKIIYLKNDILNENSLRVNKRKIKE